MSLSEARGRDSSLPALHGPLTPTRQGFGQHEPVTVARSSLLLLCQNRSLVRPNTGKGLRTTAANPRMSQGVASGAAGKPDPRRTYDKAGQCSDTVGAVKTSYRPTEAPPLKEYS